MSGILRYYTRACREYEERARILDSKLYSLCRKYPNHDDVGGTHAKLWLISRGYQTGIERQIPSTGRQGGSLETLAQHLARNNRSFSQILTHLDDLSGRMSPDTLSEIVKRHGQVTRLVGRKVRNDQVPRSFAAKYLHFQCSRVPIYDAVASRTISGLYRLNKNLKVFRMPKGADKRYYEYCLRFWKLWQDLRGYGEPRTVRRVDYFLLYLDRNLLM